MKHPWYSIRALASRGPSAAASADAPTRVEVLIYGDIGESWYGDTIAAKDFVKDFAAIDAAEITVRINSYGGSVTDGIAIYNAIKRHPAQVTVAVDGAAYSVASLIAMAADVRHMADNALMMIHAPWSLAVGNSADMREQADVLDKYAEAMAQSYVTASGKPRDAIMALLTDGVDHWYTAAEAKAEGFVTDVIEATPVAASLSAESFARFDKTRLPAALAQRISAKAPPLPAAAAAQPTEQSTMTPDEIQAAAAKAKAEGIAAEAKRRDDITAAFAKFAARSDVAEAQAACLADVSCTPEQANAKLLDVLGKGAEPIQGTTRIGTVEDEADKRRAGMSLALEIRAGLAKNDTTNPYRGDTLLDMAQASLERSGVNTRGMDKMAKVAAAFTHSSGDFPLLLANVANKAMLMGWNETEETFPLWTNKGTLPDFKQAQTASLNTFPALDQILPGQEYKYATIGEHGATRILYTYGKMFSINRAAIINDDLEAFTKVPRLMGRAAMRKLGDLVYALITAPVTFNGTALFHSTRNNLAASGTAISTTSVDAAMAAMALQADNGNTLNIKPRYLLCPVGKRGAALVVQNSEFEVGASTKNNTTPNFVRGLFETISDPRLDAASATAWYMAGDPSQYDTITVDYLDGNDQPVLEQQNGWTIDGVEFKVRMDAGANPLDYRALYKNPGA